ncbi:protein phosphatase Slingshot homolog 2 isoform X3 [Esox lucius]|uniref:protein phosphatase Slingshot homolog 2 isoform X3 n=1 Tax=Esox lucius TaxID=8010 RepID=UPI001476DBB8|nr:protein phosphatase Slingshot homolog 2 isoform X3 [Esox lucius]
MTLGMSATGSSAESCFCSCCGAKMMPYFSDDGVASQNQINQLISESFLTVKGAALFLPRGNGSSSSSAPRLSQRRNKHTGDLQQHLQTMFTVLRPEDNIRLAVRLESAYAQPQCTRYMVVVSTNGRQDTEESVVLGMDFSSADSSCTVGLVLPLWSDTLIHLDGDGGFSVSTVNRVHVFKPVSVQAMWSALQSLHKACEVARCHNYYPGSLFLTWVSYYQSRVSSDQVCINQWNAMQDVQSHRADSPILFTDVPTERERTERLIKTRLREIMMQKDLENVTSKEIRTELEMQMVCNLREFKEFIDNEMIVILGQMDSPTEIFDHVYLGSEWNASNLEELQNSGVRYILNVTREIDNFFPGMFEYHNIRVYDEEATNLLEYWNDTYKFITKAKKAGAKCLVHCKMGVSRSASTVIAYAMKEYGWDLGRAFDHVKERRTVTKPNPSFMRQLEEYQGILLASKQRHNKLWRSHSDSDLSERYETPLCKTRPHSHTLGRSDLHHHDGPAPSLKHLLASAVLQALGGADEPDGQTEGSLTSGTNSEPSRLTRSHSHSPVSGLSNGLGESRETLFLPLLPRPQAAAVHQDAVDNSSLAAVAVTVPVAAVPHPPPSLHVPPPSPQLSAKVPHLGLSGPRLPSPVPELKSHCAALTLDLPDPGRSEVIPQAALQSSDNATNTSGRPLTDPLGGRGDCVTMISPGEPMGPVPPTMPLSEGPCDNDDNNNPRGTGEPPATELEEQGKNSPTTEDGSAQALSPHPDNGVSVRHLVTEIESISHPAAPVWFSQQLGPEDHDGETPLTPPCYPQSPSTPPSDLPAGSVRRATKQLEQKLRQELDLPLSTLPSQRSPLHTPSTDSPAADCPPLVSPAADCPPLVSPAADCPPLVSPAADCPPLVSPAADCPPLVSPAADCPPLVSPAADCPPLVSPAADCPPLVSPAADCPPLVSPAADCPPLVSPAADCPPLVSPAADCLLQHRLTSTPDLRTLTEVFSVSQGDTESARGMEQGRFVVSDMDIGPHPVFPSYPNAHPFSGPVPTIALPSLDLSPAHPPPSPTRLWLEGVTALDSDTDGPSPLHRGRLALARSSEELAKIQETLRELHAFLYEAGGFGAGKGPGTLGQAASLHGRYRRETPRWQRAMEVEARIRQAGLTTPSLMKRSASLAKLDCLELSANDLSDWDLRPPTKNNHRPQGPPPVPIPNRTGPDDVSKKLRILSVSPPISPSLLDPDRTESDNPKLGTEDDPSPSAFLLQGEEREEGLETDHSPQLTCTQSPKSAVPMVASARQQQPLGKSHPQRRLRKAADKRRTATLFYNTM